MVLKKRRMRKIAEWVGLRSQEESGSFFGRAIPNELELRDKIIKDKERTLKAWGPRPNQDDEFEKLIKERKRSNYEESQT